MCTTKRRAQLRNGRSLSPIRSLCDTPLRFSFSGHNLDESHRLNDGGLRHTVRNLQYSLNKKKRWLLPDIIEERILERVPSAQASKTSKSDETFSIDDRLKIVMYENENIHHDSTCIRYANSQTEPRVLYKDGRRFNSTTLTKWMEFDQRHRWRARQRDNDTDRVNQPNFGFQQRAGFFPSEVTYEFVYPKRLPDSATRRPGKSAIWYTKDPHETVLRVSSDTNKNRRSKRRQTYAAYKHENDLPLEEDLMEEESTIIVTAEILDENDKWSIVFDDAGRLSLAAISAILIRIILDEELSASLEFPIDCFIPTLVPSACTTDAIHQPEPMPDRKARKYFEPPAPSPTSGSSSKPSIVDEQLLYEISCGNESDFLTLMQQPALNISQANLSPATFVQRTSSSQFSVVYTYCRASSTVKVTTKYTGVCPALKFDKSTVTLETFVPLVSQMLDASSGGSDNKRKAARDYKVDDLRGSLPVSTNIQQRMLLVQPSSTDRETALHNERILVDKNSSTGQWFDTTSNECEMLECAVCCDVLTANDAHQLLPCTCLSLSLHPNLIPFSLSDRCRSTHPLPDVYDLLHSHERLLGNLFLVKLCTDLVLSIEVSNAAERRASPSISLLRYLSAVRRCVARPTAVLVGQVSQMSVEVVLQSPSRRRPFASVVDVLVRPTCLPDVLRRVSLPGDLPPVQILCK